MTDYEKLSLVPKYSEIDHRCNVDTSVNFLNHIFDLPVIPANMKCTISRDWMDILNKLNIFGIAHRFGDIKPSKTYLGPYEIENKYKFVNAWGKYMYQHSGKISISIGVDPEWIHVIRNLYSLYTKNDFILYTLKDNIDNNKYFIVTIDVAHGHHKNVIEQIKNIKNSFPKIKIIAGNIMTTEAATDLVKAGADAIKVGLSCGKSCSTYNQTGIGSINMFKTIREISYICDVPIIADGGIRNVGDICKAIVAGADMVMVGSMFASCNDSPAPLVDIRKHWWNKHEYKKNYFGSASIRNKGSSMYVEGLSDNYLNITPSFVQTLGNIKQGIQSFCSYMGCSSLKDIYKQQIDIQKL